MEKFKGYNMDVHTIFMEKLEELQKKGISQNKIAEQIGVSSGQISMYKSGVYEGDIQNLEAKLLNWFDILKRKEKKLIVPYVEISATKLIYKAIDASQRDKDFSVIIGNAGNGKTETCKKYASENKLSLYIKINRSTVGVLLRAIAKELRIDSVGVTITLFERIINCMKGRDFVIVVDEADYLNNKCLEMLRHISDDAEVGVVLIGLPRLQTMITDFKADYQQLLRRIGTFLDMSQNGKYNIVDATSIINSVFPTMKEDTIKEFYKLSKGSIGTLTKLLGKSFEIAIQNSRDVPTIIDLEASCKVVMRAGFSLISA